MAIILELDCPHCGGPVRIPDAGRRDAEGACEACGRSEPLHAAAGSPTSESDVEPLRECLACGCDALYRTKLFPRKIGLAIIGAAAVAMFAFDSPLPIVAASLLDAVLYFFLPDVAVCYRCAAHHRGAPGARQLESYDLERASSFEKIPWVKKRHLNHPGPDSEVSP